MEKWSDIKVIACKFWLIYLKFFVYKKKKVLQVCKHLFDTVSPINKVIMSASEGDFPVETGCQSLVFAKL